MIHKKRLLSRAQGLSMRAVVLIALALLVLIVVGTLFLRSIDRSTCQLDDFSVEIECNKACASKSSLGDAVFTECVQSCTDEAQEICEKGER